MEGDKEECGGNIFKIAICEQHKSNGATNRNNNNNNLVQIRCDSFFRGFVSCILLMCAWIKTIVRRFFFVVVERMFGFFIMAPIMHIIWNDSTKANAKHYERIVCGLSHTQSHRNPKKNTPYKNNKI